MRPRRGRILAAGLAWSLAALAAGCAPTGGREAVAPGLLEGTWRATEAERNGAPAPDLVGHMLLFSGETFEIVDDAGVVIYDGRFAANGTVSPATIDFVNERGEAAGQTWLGIWAREGTGLRVVDNAPDPTRPRPAAFAAPAGSGYVALRFAREE